MSGDIYGEHAALLDDCYVTVITNGTRLHSVKLQHMPSGTTVVKNSEGSQMMTKRAALEELAAVLATR